MQHLPICAECWRGGIGLGICYGAPGSSRPTELSESAADDGLVGITVRRVSHNVCVAPYGLKRGKHGVCGVAYGVMGVELGECDCIFILFDITGFIRFELFPFS